MPDSKNTTTDEADRTLAKRFHELVTGEKLYLQGDLDLWKVSKLLETNRNYLSRAINRCFGKTFSTIINEWRVDESLRVMRDEIRLTVDEIARRSGFNDRRSFFRIFKRAKGMVPSEYREKMANHESIKP